MTNIYFKTIIKKSSIHGNGRFADEKIDKGTLVLIIDGNIHKNENNSFINHSIDNNLDWNGDTGWISNRVIEVGDELTMNYHQWIKTDLLF